jgi:hypothetical protein
MKLFNCLDAGRYQRFSGATLVLGRQGKQQKLLLRLILMGDCAIFIRNQLNEKTGVIQWLCGNVNAVASRLSPRRLDILS